MADYTQPAAVEQRVRFFDGQYLQDQDFADEQKYHLDRERRLSKTLRITGIVEGLGVTSTKANQVTVDPGTAIDSLGRQLVLLAQLTAQQRSVDLPAAKFKDKQGIKLYIVYQEDAVLPATTGIKGERRFQERPRLVAVAPDGQSSETTAWDDKTAAVLLTQFNLGSGGAVQLVASTAQFAGMSLNGKVGIGNTDPKSDLDIGNFESRNRYLTLKVAGGNTQRAGLRLWAWQENYGFSMEYDERAATGNGLHIKTHNLNADGVSQLFVGWSGNIGIGTTGPGAKLDVVGVGGTTVDLSVNGRIRSNNNDGGLWVASDRFVGGHSTDRIGIWNGDAWRLSVSKNGNVGIGTIDPGAKLHVNGSIRSPMWNVVQVMDRKAGPLPVSATFNCGGGTLLIFVSGTAFRSSSGFFSVVITIDDNVGSQQFIDVYTNEANSHKAFPATGLLYYGISAGSHTLKIASWQGVALSDSNDRFYATILELPF